VKMKTAALKMKHLHFRVSKANIFRGVNKHKPTYVGSIEFTKKCYVATFKNFAMLIVIS
jgi:hypothetical protein